jgi:hypothetical protein
MYAGDDVPSSGHDVELVNENATMELMWSLYKPSDGEVTSGIDSIYVGFTNAKFLGYKGPPPLGLFYQRDANMSCPSVPRFCRETYKSASSTDQVTGRLIGPPTLRKVYDTRLRPWYRGSMARGDIWSDPYPFASNSELGISAARRLITASGKLLGVIAVDYKLSTLAKSLYVADDDFLAFVVDKDGVLIASSAFGAAVDGFNNRVVAVDSPNPVIAATAAAIYSEGGWISANGTIQTVEIPGNKGLVWAQSQVIQSYGLVWHIVVTQVVRCDRGFYVPVAFKDTECLPCPTGAVCLGGTTLPYPKPGFWVDRGDLEFSGNFYPCRWATCTGFQVSEHTNAEPSGDRLACWQRDNHSSTLCDASHLECKQGSEGPLCGHCSLNYDYQVGSRTCLSCKDARNSYPLVTFMGLVLCVTALLLALYCSQWAGACFIYLVELLYLWWQRVHTYPPFNFLRHVDSGQLKIMWATGIWKRLFCLFFLYLGDCL